MKLKSVKLFNYYNMRIIICHNVYDVIHEGNWSPLYLNIMGYIREELITIR